MTTERITQGPWECFHCGFKTSDKGEAAGHFGDIGEEQPLCLVWADLDGDGRASEYQNMSSLYLDEADENNRLRAKVESLEADLKRCREALERISHGDDVGTGVYWWSQADCRRIAKEALNAK